MVRPIYLVTEHEKRKMINHVDIQSSTNPPPVLPTLSHKPKLSTQLPTCLVIDSLLGIVPFTVIAMILKFRIQQHKDEQPTCWKDQRKKLKKVCKQ